MRTVYNYDYTKETYETIDEPSQTVPGQSMTIYELFERYSLGQPLTKTFNPQYSDDPSFDDDIDTELPGFDLADYTEKCNELENIVTEKERIRAEKLALAKEQRKKEFEEFKKFKEQKNEKPVEP